ncbi:hypothetical protein BDA99DRAFT_537057 [Phascolomyces articulosus]|uniref:Uncharacterized protein n=1 Tax=Phascolomyces articulosus TaxID=60185 RepID=A0AAD5K176_9FUNG|nr:hypothetical protein BDA99DRAFT_537057 [Phascolomyces articulosus]
MYNQRFETCWLNKPRNIQKKTNKLANFFGFILMSKPTATLLDPKLTLSNTNFKFKIRNNFTTNTDRTDRTLMKDNKEIVAKEYLYDVVDNVHHESTNGHGGRDVAYHKIYIGSVFYFYFFQMKIKIGESFLIDLFIRHSDASSISQVFIDNITGKNTVYRTHVSLFIDTLCMCSHWTVMLG